MEGEEEEEEGEKRMREEEGERGEEEEKGGEEGRREEEALEEGGKEKEEEEESVSALGFGEELSLFEQPTDEDEERGKKKRKPRLSYSEKQTRQIMRAASIKDREEKREYLTNLAESWGGEYTYEKLKIKLGNEITKRKKGK